MVPQRVGTLVEFFPPCFSECLEGLYFPHCDFVAIRFFKSFYCLNLRQCDIVTVGCQPITGLFEVVSYVGTWSENLSLGFHVSHWISKEFMFFFRNCGYIFFYTRKKIVRAKKWSVKKTGKKKFGQQKILTRKKLLWRKKFWRKKNLSEKEYWW